MTDKKRGRKAKGRKQYSTYISTSNYSYIKRTARANKRSMADTLNHILDMTRKAA